MHLNCGMGRGGSALGVTGDILPPSLTSTLPRVLMSCSILVSP